MKRRIVWEIGKPSSFRKLVGRLEKAQYRVKNIKPFMERVSNEVDQLFLRRLRRELATYPSPKYKLKPKFASKKQHDFVMFLWRTRKIVLPTERSPELAESWTVKSAVKNDNIQLTISTSDEKAQFVVGKVGLSQKPSDIKKLESPIQPFARANRWRPAHTVGRHSILPYLFLVCSYHNILE
jgi:hypothetical protein